MTIMIMYFFKPPKLAEIYHCDVVNHTKQMAQGTYYSKDTIVS